MIFCYKDIQDFLRTHTVLLVLHILYIFMPAGKLEKYAVPAEWSEMVGSCTKLMKDQVKKEIHAAITYLAMVRS